MCGQPVFLNLPCSLLLTLICQVSELTEEQKEYLAKMEANKEGKAAEEVEAKGPTAFFHGKDAKDYQVRPLLFEGVSRWGPFCSCGVGTVVQPDMQLGQTCAWGVLRSVAGPWEAPPYA